MVSVWFGLWIWFGFAPTFQPAAGPSGGWKGRRAYYVREWDGLTKILFHALFIT